VIREEINKWTKMHVMHKAIFFSQNVLNLFLSHFLCFQFSKQIISPNRLLDFVDTETALPLNYLYGRGTTQQIKLSAICKKHSLNQEA